MSKVASKVSARPNSPRRTVSSETRLALDDIRARTGWTEAEVMREAVWHLLASLDTGKGTRTDYQRAAEKTPRMRASR